MTPHTIVTARKTWTKTEPSYRVGTTNHEPGILKRTHTWSCSPVFFHLSDLTWIQSAPCRCLSLSIGANLPRSLGSTNRNETSPSNVPRCARLKFCPFGGKTIDARCANFCDKRISIVSNGEASPCQILRENFQFIDMASLLPVGWDWLARERILRFPSRESFPRGDLPFTSHLHLGHRPPVRVGRESEKTFLGHYLLTKFNYKFCFTFYPFTGRCFHKSSPSCAAAPQGK